MLHAEDVVNWLSRDRSLKRLLNEVTLYVSWRAVPMVRTLEEVSHRKGSNPQKLQVCFGLWLVWRHTRKEPYTTTHRLIDQHPLKTSPGHCLTCLISSSPWWLPPQFIWPNGCDLENAQNAFSLRSRSRERPANAFLPLLLSGCVRPSKSRLVSIASDARERGIAGPRCGKFTLVHGDQRRSSNKCVVRIPEAPALHPRKVPPRLRWFISLLTRWTPDDRPSWFCGSSKRKMRL